MVTHRSALKHVQFPPPWLIFPFILEGRLFHSFITRFESVFVGEYCGSTELWISRSQWMDEQPVREANQQNNTWASTQRIVVYFKNLAED